MNSPVALHQKHAIVFIEMLKQMPKFYSKSQNAKNQNLVRGELVVRGR